MRYAVVTFGCRVNQADSLRFEEELRADGGEAAPPDDADLVIVNTCSVTAAADQGARRLIRRVARANPAARIVVTGCYATRQPEDTAALPGVIRLVPNDGKEALLSSVLTATDRPAQGGTAGTRPGIEPGAAGRTAFTLRVQTGCEEACTYCIVPTTRGRLRSAPPVSVLRHVERLAAQGYKEIVLTGVHLGAYGRDLFPAVTLTDLLRCLATVPADVRYRISSLEPMDCQPALVDLFVGAGCFEPHFHLPLQHASDRLLRAMARPYTIGQFDALVESIRKRLPHASIGTDVIVGFPGEADGDAATLEHYLANSPLTHVHVFPYSDRPGTPASMMTGKVPGTIIRAHGQRLRAIGAELARRFRLAQVGTVRSGLTIGDGTLVVTDNYLKVRIAPGLPRNRRVDVLVESGGEPMRGTVQQEAPR